MQISDDEYYQLRDDSDNWRKILNSSVSTEFKLFVLTRVGVSEVDISILLNGDLLTSLEEAWARSPFVVLQQAFESGSNKDIRAAAYTVLRAIS